MQITYYTPFDDESKSTKAEFGIYIPEWKMNLARLKLVRTKTGGYFVTAPSYKDKEDYKPLFSFDEEIQRRFFTKALKCVEDYIASGKAGVSEGRLF